jgi:hypothetical protein
MTSKTNPAAFDKEFLTHGKRDIDSLLRRLSNIDSVLLSLWMELSLDHGQYTSLLDRLQLTKDVRDLQIAWELITNFAERLQNREAWLNKKHRYYGQWRDAFLERQDAARAAE